MAAGDDRWRAIAVDAAGSTARGAWRDLEVLAVATRNG